MSRGWGGWVSCMDGQGLRSEEPGSGAFSKAAPTYMLRGWGRHPALGTHRRRSGVPGGQRGMAHVSHAILSSSSAAHRLPHPLCGWQPAWVS